MTKQEIFEKAVTKFAEQGEPCLTPNGKCAYLNHKGQRCIFGLIVPDEFIELLKDCEVTAFNLLRGKEPEYAGIREYFLNIAPYPLFWSALQTLHDTDYGLYSRVKGEMPYVNIRTAIKAFAQSNDLNTDFMNSVDFTRLENYTIKPV